MKKYILPLIDLLLITAILISFNINNIAIYHRIIIILTWIGRFTLALIILIILLIGAIKEFKLEKQKYELHSKKIDTLKRLKIMNKIEREIKNDKNK
jgi:hypothetical protein